MDSLIDNEKIGFDYKAIEPGYYDKVFQNGSGIQSKWHHLKFSHVLRRMDNYQSHLDIGCGPGTFIGLLDENKTSVGIDVAPGQIDYAKKKYGSYNHRFENMESVKELAFEKSSFDVVTLIEVIEHIPHADVFDLLKESHRVLRSDGRILMTTPNYKSLWPLV